MKRLLVATTLLLLTASAVGCRWCNRWWRGAQCDPCGTVVCEDPCAPSLGCDSCGSGATIQPGPMVGG